MSWVTEDWVTRVTEGQVTDVRLTRRSSDPDLRHCLSESTAVSNDHMVSGIVMAACRFPKKK